MKIFYKLVFGFLLLSSSFSLLCIDQHTNNWITEASSCQQTGSWLAQDKNGKNVLLKGVLISKNCTPLFSDAYFKNVAALFADAMEQTVRDWAQKSRCARYYINCRSFLTGKSARDRRYGIFYEKMLAPLQKNDGTLYYLFTVSEQSSDREKKILGAAIFDIKKEYYYGTVELDLLSVKQEAQSRGLSTILSSAIFTFLPQTKRLILDVLRTNQKAIMAYEYFGFTKYQKECNLFTKLIDPEDHYEYLANLPTCQKLQNKAATFINLKA